LNLNLKKILISDFDKNNECNSFKTEKGDDFIFIVPKNKNLIYYGVKLIKNTS